ncbi:MAG: tyrosine-type recombinase/integrase [Proteobacteria bacterium]|nr:tyrosine-type recombinase/integrase [Pseudomonadota bacterium]
MSEEQGLSEITIQGRNFMLQKFLIYLHEQKRNLMEITPIFIDEYIEKKCSNNKYSRRTIQSDLTDIRLFLRYAQNQNWCQKNLADSIKTPRIYKNELLPSAPNWKDVKELLIKTKTDYPTDIRDYAILMLLSIYGMRRSEVRNLRLEDIDWRNETISIRRKKTSKSQLLPLSPSVGEAILNYLKNIRQNNCSAREIFLCMNAPYRSLCSGSISTIVSRRLEPLNLKIKHHGAHALRHACATFLINEGIPLKEISDYLGHQELDSTRIYAKVDLTNLRKVSADLKLGDLL